MEDHKMKVLEGKVVADGAKIGIVAAPPSATMCARP